MNKLAILLISTLPFIAHAEGEKTKQVFISPGVVSIEVSIMAKKSPCSAIKIKAMKLLIFILKLHAEKSNP